MSRVNHGKYCPAQKCLSAHFCCVVVHMDAMYGVVYETGASTSISCPSLSLVSFVVPWPTLKPLRSLGSKKVFSGFEANIMVS